MRKPSLRPLLHARKCGKAPPGVSGRASVAGAAMWAIDNLCSSPEAPAANPLILVSHPLTALVCTAQANHIYYIYCKQPAADGIGMPCASQAFAIASSGLCHQAARKPQQRVERRCRRKKSHADAPPATAAASALEMSVLAWTTR
eukprot:365347-Chlamydomonas_euryale.AAC.27